MIYRIKIKGRKYDENYTFETPKEGEIEEEVEAILVEMKSGNIDKVELTRES